MGLYVFIQGLYVVHIRIMEKPSTQVPARLGRGPGGPSFCTAGGKKSRFAKVGLGFRVRGFRVKGLRV